MRADGRTDGRTYIQTDMTKLIVAFRHLANAPEKGLEVFSLGSQTPITSNGNVVRLRILLGSACVLIFKNIFFTFLY